MKITEIIPEDDTAHKTGDIDDCLFSLGNRVEIAKLVRAAGREDLIYTQLEDIYTSAQLILDEFCVKER